MRSYLFYLLFTLSVSSSIYGQDYTLPYQNLLDEYCIDGAVDYLRLSNNKKQVDQLIDDISTTNLQNWSESDIKAYYINTYNIIVISQILDAYPITSVKKIKGFFTDKHNIAHQNLSLDEIEKMLLPSEDARLHFALVCGAKSCPPLLDKCYTGDLLNSQLDQATTLAMHAPQIVNPENKYTWLSMLFNWYGKDIGDPISFINKYRSPIVSRDAKTKYLPYDWSLNQASTTGNNINSTAVQILDTDQRYYASNLYEKGEYEWYIFNNNYTQHDRDIDRRNNFFSTFIRYTRGYSSRLNYSLELKFRSVTEGPADAVGRFESLKFGNSGFTSLPDGQLQQSRIGFTAITPRIKYQPIRSVANLSVEHGIAIPLTFDGEGGSENGYIDWNTPSIFNDIFYDVNLSSKSSLFLQVGFYVENIGSVVIPSRDGYFQYSNPISVIYSYFPTPKSTIYGLINAAPKWGYQYSNGGEDFTTFPDHYNQYGLGYKYFVSDNLQLELLVTKFYGIDADRSAATYNIGARYFGR